MPTRETDAALYDILETIHEIEALVHDTSFETFNASWVIRRAVERGIEIISEASRRIPDEMKARHSDIPWSKIAAIGNILRHEYAHISPSIIWDVVQVHLHPLKTAVETLSDQHAGTSGEGASC